MNFIKELGIKAFGSRLKNLSDTLTQDVLKTYRELNIDFEPRWFTLFQLLLSRKTVTITEIASELGQTHPAAVQVVNILENKGLIVTGSDPHDQRKRLVSLSPEGLETARRLELTWTDIFEVTREILMESDPDFLGHISMLEEAISRKSLHQRIKERLKSRMRQDLDLVPYQHGHQDAFSNLNISWLEEYLEVSDYDRKILSNPEQEILLKGGMIFMLTLRGEVIGCFSLRKVNDKACELLKFTIRKDLRGWGLGKMMLGQAMDKAREAGYVEVLLFTHKKLKPANALYRKAGFTERDTYHGFVERTGRPSILMEYIINP